MDRPYIITVNRAAIDAGEPFPIRLEYVPTGAVTDHASLVLDDAIIISGPQRQDGARVWIEASDAGERSA